MLASGFYLMDCMKGMAQFPDKFFDLAIVDPPYGICASKMTMGSGKHSFSKSKTWDTSIPDKAYFYELFRVSRNQIIWGGNYFTDNLPPSKHWIVWDKKNPNLSFAEGEMAWVREGNLLRIFQHYSASVEEFGKMHPTQKPIALYKWLLTNYAHPGDKILDTHVGSASSLIACHQLGFQYWGFELDADYYKAASERLAKAKSQISLLDIAPEQFEQTTL